MLHVLDTHTPNLHLALLLWYLFELLQVKPLLIAAFFSQFLSPVSFIWHLVNELQVTVSDKHFSSLLYHEHNIVCRRAQRKANT